MIGAPPSRAPTSTPQHAMLRSTGTIDLALAGETAFRLLPAGPCGCDQAQVAATSDGSGGAFSVAWTARHGAHHRPPSTLRQRLVDWAHCGRRDGLCGELRLAVFLPQITPDRRAHGAIRRPGLISGRNKRALHSSPAEQRGRPCFTGTYWKWNLAHRRGGLRQYHPNPRVSSPTGRAEPVFRRPGRPLDASLPR